MHGPLKAWAISKHKFWCFMYLLPENTCTTKGTILRLELIVWKAHFLDLTFWPVFLIIFVSFCAQTAPGALYSLYFVQNLVKNTPLDWLEEKKINFLSKSHLIQFTPELQSFCCTALFYAYHCNQLFGFSVSIIKPPFRGGTRDEEQPSEYSTWHTFPVGNSAQ